MLESEETQLVPIDPEIEKTLKQLRKELKVAKKKKKSEMGDQQPLLRDLWIPKDQSIATGVVQPVIQANNFELKPALITMIQHSQFGGSATEDPHDHIRTFLEYCNTLKCNGVTANAIRLSLFPFSLRDGAKIWLHSLPVHLKVTWEHLLQTFLERYFPPTKAVEFRDKITRFAQFDGESLYDAWQRFQKLIRMCPHHGLEKWLILQTFYKGLTHQTRSFVDSAAGGGIMNKTLDEAFELIESMASHHFQWSSERATPPQQPGIFQLSSSDSIAAQVEILNKQMTQILSAGSSSVASSIQSIQACQICGISGHLLAECTFYTSAESSVSEVNFAQNQGPFSQSYNPSWRNHPNLSYRSNQSMQPYPSNASNLGFRNQQQQQQFGNQRQQGFQGNSSSGMDDIIKMQLELMNKMTSEVSTIKDSMQNLTTRMDNLVASQAANSSEPKLPSQSEANPRGHCGSITTRGGTVISPVVPNSQRLGILPTPVAETPPSIPLPAQPAYVPPALRKNVQSDKQQEVENDQSSARPSVLKPINLESVRIPFPERLEKSKEDKQFAKFWK